MTATAPSAVPPVDWIEVPDRSSRYLEPDIETMPRPALEALQEERLLGLLPHVYERSPLVRQIWRDADVHPGEVTTLAEFRRHAPFLDKDDVRRYRDQHGDRFGGLLCTDPAALKVIGTTSGTTGDPTPVPQQPFGPQVRGMSRDLWELGARPGDTALYLMFTFRAGHGIERFEQLDVAPVFVDQSPADVPALLEAARRFEPTVAYLFNNLMIAAIADHAEATGDDPADAFASVGAAAFGGEPMSDRSRALLDRWGMSAREMTSLGDVLGAMECREVAGYHAWEDLALVEHLDTESGREAADGAVGELVVTSLVERVAPLVRYRFGDLVTLTREPCACGRTHARAKVRGRTGDEVVVDGRAILPIDVWPFVEAVPATAAGLFQIVRPQRHCDALRLRVGTADPGAPGLRGELVDAVGAGLGVPVEVELVEQEVLLRSGPPHKIPRVARS